MVHFFLSRPNRKMIYSFFCRLGIKKSAQTMALQCLSSVYACREMCSGMDDKCLGRYDGRSCAWHGEMWYQGRINCFTWKGAEQDRALLHPGPALTGCMQQTVGRGKLSLLRSCCGCVWLCPTPLVLPGGVPRAVTLP